MFGYVTIYHKGLEKPELDRYQAYYCGLCRTLGQKYGLPGQLTLSYDLAFIAILHSALYEPETQFSAGRCAPQTPRLTLPLALTVLPSKKPTMLHA